VSKKYIKYQEEMIEKKKIVIETREIMEIARSEWDNILES
jgi:hypothetical protein